MSSSFLTDWISWNKTLYSAVVLGATLLIIVGTKVTFLIKTTIQKRRALKDYPGPPAHWLWGSRYKIPSYHLLTKNIEWSELYQNRYQIRTGPFEVVLVLSHPEFIKTIYNTAEPKDKIGYALLKPWLGDGLLVSRGSKWFRNRKLLTPAFHFEILKPYQEVFSCCTNTLVEKWRNTYGASLSQNIFHHISLLTLDSLMRCIFGVESNYQLESKTNPYITAVYTLSETLTKRFRNPLYMSDLIFHLSSAGRRYRQALRTVHTYSKIVIQQRKAERESMQEGKNPRRRKYLDFIDMLLECRDSEGQGLTDQEIQDEVDTFMFEGHDTTASGISWCLYNLAQHPHYQQKCRDEVENLLGDRSHIAWEDLGQLPYLTMCIKESLRLTPPVLGSGRETTKELEFVDGKKIPAGTVILVSIFSCHHNPNVWTQPEIYDPERFNDENSRARHPHAFIPFSAGPRNCIGQHFAMNELKTCLALLLKNFEFLEDGSRPTEKIQAITLRARDPGMFLKVRPLHVSDN